MDPDSVKVDIVRALSALMASEPRHRSELDAWIRNASQARALMEQDDGTLMVPHVVWHYIDDADIRLKDRHYAEAQLQGLVDALEAWTGTSLTGVIPPVAVRTGVR